MQVDELYEAFCIQSRLRDGASRMKQAFSSSPSTKATKESISEVNRRYKEYTENMSTFESELENLLGEFHIKMKGLAGFARLCPGDQYEIFMRYGRQRWKLKGKIEVNSRQSWDGEEMVFMPLITDLINIKTKELFTAMPQVVAVDVNDLGTIKLNLEVDELYEAFCIQSRLRDGASRMKQAFSSSPLCPGDQYEIFMRYGRQRWKLKGKIEVNSRQSWDGEEMVFMPLITDLINIKTKELFTAMPQVVAVDVNDLGTIKLNLEVTWFQGTPETPTFQDTHFFVSPAPPLGVCASPAPTAAESPFTGVGGVPRVLPLQPGQSTLPDDVFDHGGCGVAECKRLSFTFSDTTSTSASVSVSTPTLSASPAPTAAGHAPDSATAGPSKPEITGVAAAVVVAPEDVFLHHAEHLELKPLELDTDEAAGSLTRQLVRRLTSTDMEGGEGAQRCGVEATEAQGGGVERWTREEGVHGGGDGCSGGIGVEEALQSLLMRLESLTQRCSQLQDLEQEVMRLEDLLKCRLPGHRSRGSSLSLTVESALESFDFLNTSDFDDEDTGGDEDGGGGGGADLHHTPPPQRSPSLDMEAGRIDGGQHPEARGHLSEALTEDTGVGNSVAGSPLPLTTGNENLDVAVVVHLQYCNHLVQLLTSGGSVWQRRGLLQKLTAQTQLFEELAEISMDTLVAVTSAADVLPGLAERPRLSALWSACSGPGGPFHTSLERVLEHMNGLYLARLQGQHPGDSAHSGV
ncbi:hypothetical protein CRUP_037017 [Coryphaenoides rupestris]|nr:hypothetical protein CRUP_037017 [Coryphaenoides rupestris]